MWSIELHEGALRCDEDLVDGAELEALGPVFATWSSPCDVAQFLQACEHAVLVPGNRSRARFEDQCFRSVCRSLQDVDTEQLLEEPLDFGGLQLLVFVEQSDDLTEFEHAGGLVEVWVETGDLLLELLRDAQRLRSDALQWELAEDEHLIEGVQLHPASETQKLNTNMCAC